MERRVMRDVAYHYRVGNTEITPLPTRTPKPVQSQTTTSVTPQHVPTNKPSTDELLKYAKQGAEWATAELRKLKAKKQAQQRAQQRQTYNGGGINPNNLPPRNPQSSNTTTTDKDKKDNTMLYVAAAGLVLVLLVKKKKKKKKDKQDKASV